MSKSSAYSHVPDNFITKARDISYLYEEIDIDSISNLLFLEREDVTYLGVLGRVNNTKREIQISAIRHKLHQVQDAGPSLTHKFIGIYNTGANHWITFVIFKTTESGYKIWFKDSLGGSCSDFLDDLPESLGVSREEIRTFLGREQIKAYEPIDSTLGVRTHKSCGVFAIRNMQLLTNKSIEELCNPGLDAFFLQNELSAIATLPEAEREKQYQDIIRGERKKLAKFYIDSGRDLGLFGLTKEVASSYISDPVPPTTPETSFSDSPTTKKPHNKKPSDIKHLEKLKDYIEKIFIKITVFCDGEKTEENYEDIIEHIILLGEEFSKISWDIKDEEAIRNKHGFRNRHEKAGNKENNTGAKLDFEALEGLKDIKYITEVATSSLNLGQILSSLKIIYEKINFVFEEERRNITELTVHDQKVGYVITLAKYVHDRFCINQMLDYINQITEYEIFGLDLENKTNRYCIGYFFVKIGETAKELSDIIKSHESVRLLFREIGKYRQILKNHPEIINSENILEISEMVTKFSSKISDLKTIIENIKTKLENIKEDGILNLEKYKAISIVSEEEEECSISKLTKVIFLKEKNSGKKESETKEGEINSLRDSINSQEEKLKKLKQQASEFSVEKSSTELAKFDTKFIRTLLEIEKIKKDNPEIDEFNYDIVRTKFTKVKIAKKKLESLEELGAFYEKLEEAKKIIEERLVITISSLSQVREHIIALRKAIKLPVKGEDIKSLEEAIENKKSELKEKESEYKTTLESEKEEKLHKTLKSAALEAEFLSKLDKSTDDTALYIIIKPNARNMAFGFLGQYIKDAFDFSEVGEFILPGSSFLTSMNKVTITRHKQVMHQISYQSEEVIATTLKEDAVPWKIDIKTLLVYFASKGGIDFLIKILPPEVTETFSGYSDDEKALVAKLYQIRAMKRFLRVDQAESICQEIKNIISSSEIRKKLEVDAKFVLAKAYIQWQSAQALNKACELLEESSYLLPQIEFSN